MEWVFSDVDDQELPSIGLMVVGMVAPPRDSGSNKVHAAVDTLGHLLALRVSPANEDDREEVRKLSEEVQQATGENVELAYLDQGYTGERASWFAAEHGIRLEVVKHEETKRGFVLLPERAEGRSRNFAQKQRSQTLVGVRS